MPIADPGRLAGDVLLPEHAVSELCERVEVAVGVFGVVVDDEPVGDAGRADEGDGVGERGVAPADFGSVLFCGVLRFVNEGIAAGEKVDGALIDGSVFEELVVGGVADGLMGRDDLEGVGDAGVADPVEVEREGADGEGAVCDAETERRLDLIEMDRK